MWHPFFRIALSGDVTFSALVATFFRRFAPDGPRFSAEEAGMYGLAAGLLQSINRKLGRSLRGGRAQNVVVQLGIGGSGKTTLIRYLILDPKANPNYKPGQICANCMQYTGKPGSKAGPCNIFAGKDVAAAGWCKVWVLKPGAKVG